MKNFLKIKITLILIIVFAAFFRLYGLDWDQGQHLHPDERFLTMVATAIKIPQSLPEYLDPQVSPMSPYNAGYSFFVYGTFPLNLTKIIGEITRNNQYHNIHFVGRILSAVFDLGIVFLLFKIGQKIYNDKAGLLAAFLYSIMVLPIQLSHFFAVDSFLNFFLVLSFYLLIHFISHPHLSTRLTLLTPTLLGLSFGLALACKISALYFLPIIGLGFLFSLYRQKNLKRILVQGSLFIVLTLLAFRLNQPQAFTMADFLNWQINPQFIKNLNELKGFNNPNAWFPPAIQWKSTTPLIFPLQNLILWGMGLPLGIISLLALGYSIITKKNVYQILIIFWILLLFIYQGIQFCKTMRYFLPIYPFLALLSANFLAQKVFFKKNITPITFIIIIIVIYPISFLSIYSRPITRVTASEWIYENIPEGSTLLFEEWDDPLPLNLSGKYSGIYPGEPVFMYDPDTPEKWQKINQKLKKVDYIVLTSNRAYGSTLKLPGYFPETINYYQSLFASSGDFIKIAEFTSYPCFPPLGNTPLFCFNDDGAEEAFTVYDHPKVMIFKKTN